MGPAGRVGVADALGGQGLTQAGADVVRDEQQRQVGRRGPLAQAREKESVGVPDRFASTRKVALAFLVRSATLRCRLVDRRPAAPPLIPSCQGRRSAVMVTKASPTNCVSRKLLFRMMRNSLI